MEISSQNGRNLDMKIFAVFDVYKQEIQILVQIVSVEFPSQSLKKEKLLNVSIVVAEDVLDK
jgi:hypothetical protein